MMLTIMLLFDDAELAGGKPFISWTVADTDKVLASILMYGVALTEIWKSTESLAPTYMSPGAAVARPSACTLMLIFSWYAVGLVAVHVVNPEYVEPGFTSTLMFDGAQVTEIAAVGVGFCAAAGAATASMENIYNVKRNEARFTVDIESPINPPSSVTLITILGIWIQI